MIFAPVPHDSPQTSLEKVCSEKVFRLWIRVAQLPRLPGIIYNGKYPDIGIHTIADWIGHSPEIALKHYARIKDEDFEKARGKKGANDAMTNALSCEIPTPNLSKSSVQNRVQSASVGGGNGLKTGENDIFIKKQKQDVTSNVFNGLRPVSDDCRIGDQISESGDLFPMEYFLPSDYNNYVTFLAR